MLADYRDIRSRIAEDPLWFDCHGVPRYESHHPDLCPNIYAQQVVLLEVTCQACRQTSKVQLHWDLRFTATGHLSLSDRIIDGSIGWNDPPRHDCVGDTMCSEDHRVLEFWSRERNAHGWPEWQRSPAMEKAVKVRETNDHRANAV